MIQNSELDYITLDIPKESPGTLNKDVSKTTTPGFFDRVFKDQRLSMIILYSWLIVFLVLLGLFGVADSDFLKFGPSETAKFMTISVDTWWKWSIIALFMFINNTVNVFVGESMGPWIQNTVQDHKNRYLPYSKETVMLICQAYYLYFNVVGMFGLFAMFIQIDFMLIRTVADILVTFFTTTKFIETKEFNPEKYDEWFKKQ
jgi:hypothetical protein